MVMTVRKELEKSRGKPSGNKIWVIAKENSVYNLEENTSLESNGISNNHSLRVKRLK